MYEPEVWKIVPGYNGTYEASDRGRIAVANYRGTGIRKVMRQSFNTDGYLKITMLQNGAKRCRQVHCVIADTFIGERQSGMQVNHISGIKTDNSPANLAYCTGSENVKHSYEIGTRSAVGERNGQAKLNSDDVVSIRTYISSGMSTRSIATMMGVSYSAIRDIQLGRRWSHVPLEEAICPSLPQP